MKREKVRGDKRNCKKRGERLWDEREGKKESGMRE